MVRVLDEAKPEETWQEQVLTEFRAFALDKKSMDHLKAHQDKIKKNLLAALEEQGEVDDKGHRWITFPDAVEGFTGMQRQRRVSQSMDEEAADKLLTERGLRDQCYKTIEVLDQDVVMGLLYEGVLSEQDIDTMFPSTVSYAFVPVKAK